MLRRSCRKVWIAGTNLRSKNAGRCGRRSRGRAAHIFWSVASTCGFANGAIRVSLKCKEGSSGFLWFARILLNGNANHRFYAFPDAKFTRLLEMLLKSECLYEPICRHDRYCAQAPKALAYTCISSALRPDLYGGDGTATDRNIAAGILQCRRRTAHFCGFANFQALLVIRTGRAISGMR